MNEPGLSSPRLFEFANFLEARIALWYAAMAKTRSARRNIIRKSFELSKIVVPAVFDADRRRVTTLKIDTPAKDLVQGPRGVAQPNPRAASRCPCTGSTSPSFPGLAFR